MIGYHLSHISMPPFELERPVVFVLSVSGWVSHGPVRASERQAHNVAHLLRQRLGWIVEVGKTPPPMPQAMPTGLPSIEHATCSPVWRDPELAKKWGKRR